MKFLVYFGLCLSAVFVSAAARAENGGYDLQWLKLVHYQRNSRGYRGTIDSPDFYLAPDGRTNPQAEWKATIALFAARQDKEKICRFQSRYLYLKNNKLIDKIEVNCKEYENFKNDLKPIGVTLLYTDAFMNNPSSLFGHTLLRIDTGRKGSQMIAHGVSYGAFTPTNENSVFFALRGLIGSYYAGWTVRPYYDVINKYNNIESRDIWELELNLSPAEVEMLVAHLWETGPRRTRYYFFTNNCSYMLMEMLDAVRPSLRLAERFPVQVIPLDTIKAVYRTPGLVSRINYRPSLQTRIRFGISQMNDAQKQALLSTIRGEKTALQQLSVPEQAAVLETAYQYVQYQNLAKEIGKKEYRRQSFNLLYAINRLNIKDKQKTEKPRGQSPLKAHESMRVTAGIGSHNGKSFQQFSFRPAYHSLTDNNYGRMPGAEINFLNLKIRRYDEGNKTVLSEFNILDITSLSPADRLFDPWSFAISLGLDREQNPQNDDEGYVLNGRVLAGKTVEAAKGLYLYAMGGVTGGYGGFLPHNQYAAAVLSVGSFVDLKYLKLRASVEKSVSSTIFADKITYQTEAAVPLAADWMLAAEYQFADHKKGKNNEMFSAEVRYYF